MSAGLRAHRSKLIAAVLLLRVQFDDELFLRRERDALTLGLLEHAAAEDPAYLGLAAALHVLAVK